MRTEQTKLFYKQSTIRTRLCAVDLAIRLGSIRDYIDNILLSTKLKDYNSLSAITVYNYFNMT